MFYHKETHYTCDYTPLVGWLKPYMFPEILNAKVPEWILKTAPDDYVNAKNAISDSKIEIERLKNYLINKTVAETVPATDDDEFNLIMDIENKVFNNEDQIEQ